ncbi:hypothetical protein [Microvirgula aerodenitrificans]|uniref:hypothetical protein n=1 Tax=Microvirgula aerodenitrificans TaxID=57480 RepID=UPI002F4043C7
MPAPPAGDGDGTDDGEAGDDVEDAGRDGGTAVAAGAAGELPPSPFRVITSADSAATPAMAGGARSVNGDGPAPASSTVSGPRPQRPD